MYAYWLSPKAKSFKIYVAWPSSYVQRIWTFFSPWPPPFLLHPKLHPPPCVSKVINHYKITPWLSIKKALAIDGWSMIWFGGEIGRIQPWEGTSVEGQSTHGAALAAVVVEVMLEGLGIGHNGSRQTALLWVGGDAVEEIRGGNHLQAPAGKWEGAWKSRGKPLAFCYIRPGQRLL